MSLDRSSCSCSHEITLGRAIDVSCEIIISQVIGPKLPHLPAIFHTAMAWTDIIIVNICLPQKL
jgi:hypothetical protein